MDAYVPKILGIAAELKDKLDVSLIVWADSAQMIKSVNNNWNVGGGTDINPAIELIDKNMPDVSIIITDGHFNTAMKKLPKSPVIWALAGEYATSDMIISRGKDKVIKVKEV
jgi:predicted metal-dependent peptidase